MGVLGLKHNRGMRLVEARLNQPCSLICLSENAHKIVAIFYLLIIALLNAIYGKFHHRGRIKVEFKKELS